MRFGKKLFLHMSGDDSGAPYLSNKQLKEVINQIVRELRQCTQAQKLNSQEEALRQHMMLHGENGGGRSVAQTVSLVTPLEMSAMKKGVQHLNQQFFLLIDTDLETILEHVVAKEAEIIHKAAVMQEEAIQAGIAFNDRQIRALERVLMCRIRDRTQLVSSLVQTAIGQNPAWMQERLTMVNAKFSHLAQAVNDHIAYLEINVAGFRKLLKRHDRQVPREFHYRPSPFLGYHGLVTADFESLHKEMAVFRKTLVELNSDEGLEIEAIQDWGPECQMVISFRNQDAAADRAFAKPSFDSDDDE